jgi:hypothetical protein
VRRRPVDPHHIRFAQKQSLGRKVSDEFTVPLCRSHHRALHRSGSEYPWWENVGIDPRAGREKSFSAQLEKLARALAHPNGDAASLVQARIIVEAELDLQRIGTAKVFLLNADIGAVRPSASASDPMSRGETTVRFGPDDVRPRAAGDGVATALINALPQLIRFDRYERRARSRQARAVQLLIVRKALPQI